MLPGQAMKNSEDEYDRRTKTILEVRGRENLVLVGVRFLLARNRSSIVLVLVLVLVSAIGCKSEDVGVPKSNKLALMGFQPREPGPRRHALRGRQIKRCHNTGQTCTHLSPFQGEPFVWMVPRVETQVYPRLGGDFDLVL
jgi:hypothetical protein